MVAGSTQKSRFMNAPFPIPQGIDQQSEGRRWLATARVVEVIAGVRRAPVRQSSDQLTAIEVLLHLLLGEIGQTKAGHGRIENECARVEHKLAIDAHSQLAAVSLKLPGVKAVGR